MSGHGIDDRLPGAGKPRLVDTDVAEQVVSACADVGDFEQQVLGQRILKAGVVLMKVSRAQTAIKRTATKEDVGGAGYRRNDIGSDLAVVRFNANGSLDTTFNGTGKVTTAFGGQDYASAAAIQADGKIVVAGGTDNLLFDFYDFVVVRYEGDVSAACPNPIDCPDISSVSTTATSSTVNQTRRDLPSGPTRLPHAEEMFSASRSSG